jgi:prefoldin alpha subunit
MLNEQIQMLDSQTQGVQVSKKTMEEFRNLPPNHEIMIPVGSNAYTEAILKNPEKVTVRISKDILIEKDLEHGIESMDKLLDNYTKISDNLEKQLEEVESRLAQIQPQVEKLYRANQRVQ